MRLMDSLADFLTDIFTFGSGNEIIAIIFIAIVLLFILGLFIQSMRGVTPALILSTGIFGTFWGIYIALAPLDFSPQAINESIEELLNGMTVAFLTSLLGLGGSIAFRLVAVILPVSKQAQVAPEDQEIISQLREIRKAIAGDDDSSIVTQIQKLRDENRDGFKSLDELTGTIKDVLEQMASKDQETISQLNEIRKAIAGDDDSSIVTQIQKLRDENRDGFKSLDELSSTIKDALVKSLENLIDEIRNVIVEDLQKSMNKLIDQIEKALIEQFGKTFVEFNQAVQALKKWQEDHRRQVEQLTDAFNQTARGIERIRSDCESIPAAMKELNEFLQQAKDQLEELDARLAAFADMKEKAEQSLPVIKKHLDAIGEELSDSANGLRGVKQALQDTQQNIQNASNEFTQHMENIKQHLETRSEDMQKEMNLIARNWGENMVAIAKRCREAIDDAAHSNK